MSIKIQCMNILLTKIEPSLTKFFGTLSNWYRGQVEPPVWMLNQCQSFYMKLFQLLCELRKYLSEMNNKNRRKIKANWHKQMTKTLDAICHCNHLTSQR